MTKIEGLKRHRGKLFYGAVAFIITVSIGFMIILIVPALNGGDANEPSKYYGPPLDNAEYETVFRSTFSEGDGEIPIRIDSSWDGISIEARYSSPCEGCVEIISPSGIKITTFDFSLTEEEIKDGVEGTSSGQYVTLQPGAWPEEIYGEWTFRYSFEGGPSDVIIKRVISFGSVPTA